MAKSPIEAPTIVKGDGRRHSATVTVACKVPCGMQLQLQHKMKRPVPTGKGGYDNNEMVEVNVFGGPKYVVEGPAVPAMGGVPEGFKMPRVEGGFALTEIPRDFWEQWLEQNAMADYVVNGMIFAYGDKDDTRADAREHEKKESGLEPISRSVDGQGRLTDRRVPKPLTSAVARIAVDAEREAVRSGGG